MDIDISQYLDAFVEESKEYLQNINDILLNLEKDTGNKDLLNEVFRVSHTLKGMAGTMGFTNMANLTHDMEDLLQALRSGEKEVNPEVIDILFECFDRLDTCVNYISENGKETEEEHTDLINKLKNILNDNNVEISKDESDKHENKETLNEYVLNVIKKAKTEGLNSYRIDISLNKDCMLKAARAFVVFNTIESFSEIIQSQPSAEDIEDEKFDLDFSITIVTKYKKDEIEKELSHISEIDKIEIVPIDISSSISDIEKEPDTNIKNTESGAEQKNDSKDHKNNSPAKNIKIGKTVRVDIDRLDNLMNLVSELIIVKTRMEDTSEQSNKESMNEAIEYLERITTSLHDAVMKVRMVPIERVFNRFPRMVRDLSKELNKEVNLEMTGEETEVDRTVIDEIGDPLIHLIRNSLDHGIEHPEERVKLGKSEVGTVKLKAYPDGNNVVIEVEDDGKGINFSKVKSKAIEKGVLTEVKAENLSKEEIIDLLFAPGFSTADTISDVSGRGVGLDVVRSKIESISGSVEVETQENIGTKFIIRIPLTLAIIQALLIKLKNEIYAIPLSSISEITSIHSTDIRDIHGQEIILYRNKTIPIVRLDKLMDVKEIEGKDEITVVVVRKGDRQAGLIVDELIGQQEIVIKPLGKYLCNVRYLAGATILGNGRISLILDVNSLF
mgnify:CR=1 FL=1